jgi:very-short-patch-repair endonuclease
MSSLAEEYLAKALAANPVPGWDLVREYRFHETRRWRFDFAFPSQKLAIEIDGQGGGHSRVKAVRDECEKYNAAVLLGWRIMRFPATDRLQAHAWARLIREVLCTKVKR